MSRAISSSEKKLLHTLHPGRCRPAKLGRGIVFRGLLPRRDSVEINSSRVGRLNPTAGPFDAPSAHITV